ncbi:iron reductase [Mycolicibacterium neworleansense]|uniref:Ferric iron reductase FhuF-like transporter n=1 Tax=Mycolicibacterium neworleansense TaxID=146018 RepID=A0A0H5RIY7_9MYCO|nr:iron reductase [Mycolicibacterium neworleansense]MCV7361824.1 iron reductase [Mycolicibacterium neworleansense]CRZ14130.1 Ferric iron reductase FhuF-like transporter [Mycolicibacterium neworleansense]
MTVLIEDPLIAGMAIERTLPLHESSRRLRELYPECPRVYGVAVVGDLSRRRWWPLAEALSADRLQGMFDAAMAETGNRAAVAQQLAATFIHVVIGRVVPLLALEGRAWDTGLENLWVHVDSEGAIDWVGVVDPTLRGLPEDPYYSDRGACVANASHDGIVALPSEAALTTWVAHRSHRALEPLFARLVEVSDGAMSLAAMWHMVGAAVVGAATQVPLLAGSSEVVSMRRGQAVLDALVGFGLPVRGCGRAGKVLLN